jgi:hypothetical protein
LPPWGGQPPLRRGSAAVPPTRSSPAPAAVFAIAQTGGSSAPSQSTTEPNLASDNTHQNGGFIRGKTPPDTRHQTPLTHQTPDTKHRQHTRHQKMEDDHKKKMKDDLKKVKMEDIFKKLNGKRPKKWKTT